MRMKKTYIFVIAIILLFCTGCGEEQHEWISATCTSPAMCIRCGMTQGEPYGHDWSEANCTEARICNRCGMTQGASLGHAWSNAKCTEVPKCTRCGIDGTASDHVISYEVVKMPNCIEAGLKKGICEVCGEEFEEEVLKTAYIHEYGEWVVANESTCSEDGLEEAKCKLCEYKKSRVLEKKSHEDDGKWVVVEKATRNEPGYKATHCKICGEELEYEEYELPKENSGTSSNANSGNSRNTDGVDPDLKAFLDSYERFMDSYVAFMKKYSETTASGDYGSILAMYQDYFDLLTQLEDFERKANAYNTSTMSSADYEYYMNTLMRIEMKLLEACSSF